MLSLSLEMKICQNKQKSPEKWKLNFSSSALFQMKTTFFLKYFVNICLWNQFFASNSLPVLMITTFSIFPMGSKFGIERF